jgi:bifunctional pyridoxal-dependent enzyme with beta-cystathionase and maltose regulon repressor activities
MHRDFFPLAEQICKKHNVLMIADEVSKQPSHDEKSKHTQVQYRPR